MKKYFKEKAIITIAFVCAALGCNKITNINKSPNNPPLTSATPEILFPSGLASSAGRIGGELNILGALWSQFYTQGNSSNQYKSIDSYDLTKNDLNDNYDELFGGALEDYQYAITKAKAAQQWNYVLMCTAMKAYTYEVLADLYDQVPYKQALQGLGNTQPAFDKGHDVYEGLISEIDSALAQNYNVPLIDVDQGTDFLFGGGDDAMAKWAQFAHTLELKMYLRMVNIYPAEAQAGVTKLYANPDFLSENAGLNNFVNTPGKDNPFYEYNIRNLNTPVNLRASRTFVSFLTATNDPRIISYFGLANPGTINQGDYNGTDPSYNTSTVVPQSPTDPVWFISAAESHFLQAEALVRYFNGAGAKTQFLAGIDASFADNNVTGLSATQFSGGSTDPNVNYDISTDKLQTIIMQKWVSMPRGCHSLEAFFDQERTGFPKISPVYSTSDDYIPGEWVYSANGVTPNNEFPKRLIFPASEQDRNKNTPTQVPLTTPVWWALTK